MCGFCLCTLKDQIEENHGLKDTNEFTNYGHGYNSIDCKSHVFLLGIGKDKFLFKHKQKLDIIYFWKSGDYVLTICDAVIGDGDQGMRVAAATYLKNFTRRNLESHLCSSEVYKEFRDQLAQALLRAEPAILRVLIEVVILLYIPQDPCA